MDSDLKSLVTIVVVVLVIAAIVAIVMKAVRIVIALGALVVIVPVFCTILWGDGMSYVTKFSAIFTPAIEQKINDGYQFYRDKYAEDPLIDMEQLEDYADEIVGVVDGVVDDALDKVDPGTVGELFEKGEFFTDRTVEDLIDTGLRVFGKESD